MLTKFCNTSRGCLTLPAAAIHRGHCSEYARSNFLNEQRPSSATFSNQVRLVPSHLTSLPNWDARGEALGSVAPGLVPTLGSTKSFIANWDSRGGAVPSFLSTRGKNSTCGTFQWEYLVIPSSCSRRYRRTFVPCSSLRSWRLARLATGLPRMAGGVSSPCEWQLP